MYVPFGRLNVNGLVVPCVAHVVYVHSAPVTFTNQDSPPDSVVSVNVAVCVRSVKVMLTPLGFDPATVFEPVAGLGP